MKHAPEAYRDANGSTRVVEHIDSDGRVAYRVQGEPLDRPPYTVRASAWAALIRDAERLDRG